MKFVIASDSYKGCLSSVQIANVMEKAILKKIPDAIVIKVPVADGGEGTVEAMVHSLGGKIINTEVCDPLGRTITAQYGIAGEKAIIEVAAACGLTLLKEEERNPLVTSTRGVGQILLDALKRGCKHFIIGLGGTATNDGGKGMIDFLFQEGIIKKAGIPGTTFTIACDVDTPFIGPNGTSRVFASQKGADSNAIEILEKRMTAYALEIYNKTGIDVSYMPGAGAAGGLGGAFKAFLGAKLLPGIEIVLDTINFDAIISGANLVITGEGQSDYQTPKGKTPSGVLKRAKKHGIPVALVSGCILMCSELQSMGFSSMSAVTPSGMSLKEAITPDIAASNIYKTILELISK